MRYSNRLGIRTFAAMCLTGYTKEIRDIPTQGMGDTAIATRTKRWWHWVERVSTDGFCHFQDTNRPYVRCSDSFDYKQCVGDILGHSSDFMSTVWPNILKSFSGFSVRTTVPI